LFAFQSLFDLSVTQSAWPGSVMVGDVLTYTAVITNNGPLTATAVTLYDTLPSNVTLASAVSSPGSCVGGSPIVCTLGDLTNAATATVTIVVTSTSEGGATNVINVMGARADLNIQNSSAAANATVIGQTFLPLILK
jgi:uncharacterized repeat protein (TIGR01451 family)